MTTIALRDPSGSFSKSNIDRLVGKARKEMIRKARAGHYIAAPRIQASLQGHVGMALKGNKAAKSIRAKVYAAKPDRFPALQIGSKIPWLAVHEHGRRITGRMLIQIGRGKGRRGAFRKLVTNLMAQGLTFWKKSSDGDLLLWAKPPKGTRGLSGAKRAERERRRAGGGSGRIGRDEAYPIAMLVRSVTVRKRLRAEATLQRNIPVLIRAMETAP